MRRLRVVYRPEAVADLEGIYRFLVRTGAFPGVAQRYVRRIRDRCGRIGDAPLGCAPREDLAPGIRLAAFEQRVVIAYRIEAEAVEITNVFYGGRDYEALYRGRDSEAS
ncbi:MAG: type II toxin-antitoxin system RelE/ParE family toxin [Caulobacteraceae bacterium]|nr:type II toxin-antitoxin system RelE/ParE family toxin [Caulobacteraceae bacterium]